MHPILGHLWSLLLLPDIPFRLHHLSLRSAFPDPLDAGIQPCMRENLTLMRIHSYPVFGTRLLYSTPSSWLTGEKRIIHVEEIT